MTETIGGGPKKVLYTLNAVRRIGLRQSTKALTAKNTCKACGLGMGGQQGGMTNEAGEFPSVCNKSVQAQSTDIQAAIPEEIFAHQISELRELSGYELEHLGRLDFPVFKAKNSSRFAVISWQDAIIKASSALKQTQPERSFFYSSGRSSNEAAFLMQLFARAYGTNNINNCSYYCHQASGVGLNNTIGSGTATVELEDLKRCDTVFIIGANPSSNHPRLIHQLKAVRERGGDVVVINPAKEPGLVKFAVPKSIKSMLTGGSDIASHYLQPNIGSDLALLQGLSKAVYQLQAEDETYIQNYCEQGDNYRAAIDAISWPEIESETGISQQDIVEIAQLYARSSATIFAWGMGITHHLNGVDNVEAIANLALLRGMIGRPGAGLLPLRGHSNVQGVGTVGVKPNISEAMKTAITEQSNIKLPEKEGLDTLACLEAAANGEMDVGFIMGGNLYEATPNTVWAKQAIDKIATKVFLTTTLNRGHVEANDHSEVLILPVCARDEEWQSTTQESMFNYVRLSDGGIERLLGVRPESQVIAAIAEQVLKDRLGADGQALEFVTQIADHNHLRKKIAAAIPELTPLAEIGEHKQEFYVESRVLHQPLFNTASRKARFAIHQQYRQQIVDDVYPYRLATMRSEGQFNSIIYEEFDSYRHNAGRDTVFANVDDISTLGFAEGDWVKLSSAAGAMGPVQLKAFDLPPGNVLAYYPEANCLTGLARDPRSQTPNFKSIAVNMTKI